MTSDPGRTRGGRGWEEGRTPKPPRRPPPPDSEPRESGGGARGGNKILVTLARQRRVGAAARRRRTARGATERDDVVAFPLAQFETSLSRGRGRAGGAGERRRRPARVGRVRPWRRASGRGAPTSRRPPPPPPPARGGGGGAGGPRGGSEGRVSGGRGTIRERGGARDRDVDEPLDSERNLFAVKEKPVGALKTHHIKATTEPRSTRRGSRET